MAKITIQSIARDLGLSRNTVSMALNGNKLVAPRTRDMVLRYAERVGYVTGVSKQETENASPPEEKAPLHHIMILRKPDVAVYWDKVINGISEEASACGCRTQVAVVSRKDEDGQLLPPGLDETIEAVFCIKLMDRGYIQKIREMGIQVFLLDNYKDADGELPGDVIETESFRPVVLLTRHLLNQGMRRIGFLNECSSLYETTSDRFAGYLYAMAQAGIEPPAEFVMPDVKSSFFYEERTFDEIVAGYRSLPEAVVCGNDEIAKFLTRSLRKKGIRVPEDVAVTGFDNDEEGMLEPFFTTVNVDAKWLGRRMVQCFLWRMRHPDAPYEKIQVTGQVILRKSSRRRPL